MNVGTFAIPYLLLAMLGGQVVHAQPLDARELSSREVLQRAQRQRVTGIELTRRGRDLAIQTAEAPVPLAPSVQVPGPVQKVPLNARLQVDAQTNAVRLDEISLRSADSWNDQPALIKDHFPGVTQANEAAGQAAQEALKADATATDIAVFADKVKENEQELVQAYAELPPDQRETGRILVDYYREVRRTSKALYGRDDRYPPLTYERIYRNSQGSVAILHVGDSEPYCSGVLVGQKLVLTNFHCTVGELPSDLKVQFNYEFDLDNVPVPGKRSFPVARFLVKGGNDPGKLDFTLLEIAADSSGQFPGDAGFAPQCLSTARVRLEDPVYLIGHPEGQPRTVHDNAFVLFPFRVTPDDRARIELAVRAEFTGVVDEQDQLDAFRASYREATFEGEPVFEHFSVAYGARPTIGADSDTFHGNSGSPAFSRRSHKVVGLLFAGEDDVDDVYTPGWRSHEAILPISEVVAHLDGALANWRTLPGVCVN
jgi:hypothetical protein